MPAAKTPAEQIPATAAARTPVSVDADATAPSARSTPLQGRGLQAGYRTRLVVDDVDLDVVTGEVHGLIGPNGAGKSTLLRVLGAILPRRGGEVLTGSGDLARLDARARAHLVSFLPQDTHVEAELSVRTIVELGRLSHRTRAEHLTGVMSAEDRRIVSESLQRVGADHLTDRRITELSGGQRQLVLLAKQLAQQSRVLLLDEPVSALDLGYQLAVLDLVQELAAEGHAVVLVLHDLNLAARSCDRITVLGGGQVRASGSPAEVLRPDLLDPLYGIRSVVEHDPLLGCPRVTAFTPETPGRTS